MTTDTQLHKLTLAVLTGSTCGFACWMAEQDTCRCSCYGKNHGIMLTDGAEQPRRQAKINGERFYLAVIGDERSISHERVLQAFEESEYGEPFATASYPGSSYKAIRGNDYWNKRRALWWAKTASASQMKWSECQPFYNPERPWRKPRILWIHESMIDAFDKWLATQD